MSSLVQLRRLDTSTPWGFRMNGGAEFGEPIYIQKVTPQSIAHKSGLRPGDGVVQIGRTSTYGMKHEGAKMEIIRAGNDVDFIVQRDAVPVGSTTHHTHNVQGSQVIVEDRLRAYRGVPAQNPEVQSRSFKMLQHQLATTD